MIRLDVEPLLKVREKSFYWLGKEARINPAVMTRIKNYRIKAVSLEVLERICVALECEPGEVIVRVKEEKKAAKKARLKK